MNMAQLPVHKTWIIFHYVDAHTQHLAMLSDHGAVLLAALRSHGYAHSHLKIAVHESTKSARRLASQGHMGVGHMGVASEAPQ